MGKHRQKKSFYDVDEDELKSLDKQQYEEHRRRHHQHRHHHRRRHESPEKSDEKKKRRKFSSFYSDPRIDDDQSALQSPPIKIQENSFHPSLSTSSILAELIENPQFLAEAGPKAKEFADTARQLLSKPDLDPTTQQIICAMAQAAVNVGKRLNSSSTNSANQSVDELSVTNSTTYSTTSLLSPTLSNASSSSTSNTPQQHSHDLQQRDETRTPTALDNAEDLLIKQMIERAMKLTQQGDTQQAQHLLSIIHEKVSNKRKRAVDGHCTNNETDVSLHQRSSHVVDDEKTQNLSNSIDYCRTQQRSSSSSDYENLNESETSGNKLDPLPPPLPPPPPPPPSIDDSNSTSTISVPRIEQVQELLSNPSEVQSILKKMFATNESYKVSPPEEYQLQYSLTPSSPYSSSTNFTRHPVSPYGNIPVHPTVTHSLVRPLTPNPSTTCTSQTYNSSLAFIQSNRGNSQSLQTQDRCLSSTNNKASKISLSTPMNNRTYPVVVSPPQKPTNMNSLVTSTTPIGSSLMKVNSTFPNVPISSSETGLTRWSTVTDPSYYNHPIGVETNPIGHTEQSRNYQPFWCATCALGFPHQVAYQEHLRSHIPCTVSGCSYAASEHLVRIHHQTIHENNTRSRLNSHSSRPIIYQQQTTVDHSWPVTRM